MTQAPTRRTAARALWRVGWGLLVVLSAAITYIVLLIAGK
jgi:hypothetical protein